MRVYRPFGCLETAYSRRNIMKWINDRFDAFVSNSSRLIDDDLFGWTFY